MANVQLLIIDPQNDFCDIPGAALPVPGARDDMARLAALIARSGVEFEAIHVTLDSHQPLDIAHPGWWCDADGQAPVPFTVIGEADVRAGRWRARDAASQPSSLAYVEQLALRGRYQLVVWPEHCPIGSWGHNVYAPLHAALSAWSRRTLLPVNYVMKGMNPGTEHYSAIRAEVPDAADLATQDNAPLIARLKLADTVYVAGEALSHCVASTVRDLIDAFGPAHTHQLVLLTECMSPVPGFEAQAAAFLQEARAQGVRTMTMAEYDQVARPGQGRV